MDIMDNSQKAKIESNINRETPSWNMFKGLDILLHS